MTKEENIFFAKRSLINIIYRSAILERINVTFENVEAFVESENTNNISISNALKLKGLKDAWEYVLSTVNEELTLDYIKKIHFEICKGQSVHPLGDFRDKGVDITGTSYRPKLPSECNYNEELENIMKIENPLDRCITLFLWVQRSQMFMDGNKRVANLVANKEMINNGMGIISVPVEKIGEYFNKLIYYYESNDAKDIKTWIYNNCIDGV